MRFTDRVLRNYTDVDDFGIEVRAAGVDLARQLFPSDLIRALWEKRDRLRVHVKSWEASIPWEVARLRHPDTKAIDDRFLAEYDLVRSFNGVTRPNVMPLEQWRYLVAEYPNKAQLALTAEKQVFTDTLNALGVEATPVAGTPTAVYQTLREAKFDVLHVCCHGEADPRDIENSRLIIGDRLVDGKPTNVTISPETVSTEANFVDRHPLVFLNACDSGHVGASLSALGGWPKAFWDAGVAAFVGTSWPVREIPAQKFCTEFYARLLAGDSLAQAAGAARATAKTSGDARWLAYKVYGNPSSRAICATRNGTAAQ